MTDTQRTPWNKGRCVGPREPLSPDDIQVVAALLEMNANPHDLCLFMLAIDTMLRASDLLSLKVSDVLLDTGDVVISFPFRQKKTGYGVYPVLTYPTRNAVAAWIRYTKKRPEHFLFTRNKPMDAQPISIGLYRGLIKRWCESAGISPRHISAHSLRRSKPVFMYSQGTSIEVLALLLGHRNTASTMHYLGLSQSRAQQEALKWDVFS